MKRAMLALLLVWPLSAGAAAARAQDEPGVARVSLLQGEVSVLRGAGAEWVAAALNAPIVVPDTLYVGAASRAEVQFDSANLIRLGANTELQISELAYQRYQVQLAIGTATFSVLQDYDTEVDINTPNISVRPIRKGSYRITVRLDGGTEITVRSGEAEIFSPSGVETLRSGRTMIVRGTASDPEFQMASALPRDDWDRWNADRDKDLRRRQDSYRYVSRDVYGVEDLYGYGRWVRITGYGWAWSPRVSVGWAPYRHGRWGWTDYYGWTWISHDPWGWAPYHYGRWFYSGGNGWCWWPGGTRGRHHWSPAHVAFIGWGTGVHVSVNVGGFYAGFGHVGWVPLGPHEPFHPWWGPKLYNGYRNQTRIDNSINIVNNTNITNIYRNSRVNGAVTAVEGANFGTNRVSNVYGAAGVRVQKASLVRGQVPVVPQRASLRVSDRQVNSASVPSPASRASFATRRASVQAGRVPFEQQQRAVEQMTRQTIEGQASRQPSTPDRSVTGAGQSPRVTNAGPSVSQPASGGWRGFGGPTRTETGASVPARSAQPSRTPAASAPSRTSGGWGRFGQPATRTRSAQPEPTAGGNTPSRNSGTATRAPSRTENRRAPAVSPSSPSSSGASQRSAPVARPQVNSRPPTRSAPAARPSSQPARPQVNSRSATRSAPAARPSRQPARPQVNSRPATRSAPAARPSRQSATPSRSATPAAPTRSAPVPRPSTSSASRSSGSSSSSASRPSASASSSRSSSSQANQRGSAARGR